MVTNEIKFEVWKSNYIIVYARKGEIDARTIVTSFKGEDGNDIDLTGKSVTFYALKPDNTKIYNSCTVNALNGTASILLTSQMVSVSGIVDCEYQIFEGNELLLKVGGLKLVVENTCDFSEAIESTSECNALISAINRAEEFSDSVGEVSDLTTTAKNTIVDAVNEINGKTIPISQGGTGATTSTQARTNLEVMTAVQLYYNASGTHGTIQLSDTIENYDKVEIYLKCVAFDLSQDYCSSTSVWNNKASYIGANLAHIQAHIENSENRVKILSSMVNLSGSSLTFGYEKLATLRPKNTSSSAGQVTVLDLAQYGTMLIYKVVGYKY